MTQVTPDVCVTHHGSLLGLSIVTPVGKAWVDENLSTEGWQWLGNTLHVEPRYAAQIVEGMQDAGLEVA